MNKILALLIAIMMLAMTIPAMAETITTDFVPSIAGKPAPGFEGTPVAYKADGTAAEIGEGGLVITPLADLYNGKAVDPATVDLLTWAYDSLQKGEDLVAIKADIEAALAGTGLTYGDMVCRDLFEVSAYGDLAEWLKEEGAYVQYVLDAVFAENQTVLVIYSDHDKNWEVFEAGAWFKAACTNTEGNFHIGMKTADLGVFSFMVVADVATPAVTSPAN